MAGFTKSFNQGVQMSIVEKDKAIKKINERYTDLVRTFGKNSALAKNYRNKMEAVFGADNMHKAKKRKTQGTKRRESAADLDLSLVSRNEETRTVSDQDIQALLSNHTSGQIKKTLKEQAERESEYSESNGGSKVSEADILAAMDYIYELEEDDDSDLYEAYKMYWDSVGPGSPRPDYSLIADLARGIKHQNEAQKEGKNEVSRNIEEQLKQRLASYNRFQAGEDYFGGV